MFNRTRFEREMESLRQYDVPPPGAGPKTHFLPIDLNIWLKGKKVGVHVPSAAAKVKKVDVIVYFHGVISVCGSEKEYISKGIDYLWSTAPFDKMRSELDASGRPAVLIVPRLDSNVGRTGTGATQYGDLHKDKAFDSLVEKALDAVHPDAEIGNIVLAAHSGGGSPMYAILAAKNDLRAKIRACWGFECLYPGTDVWLKWLKENTVFRFRHFRQECVFTKEAGKLRVGAPGQFVDTLTYNETNAHCNLIKDFWNTVISRMPMTAGSGAAY